MCVRVHVCVCVSFLNHYSREFEEKNLKKGKKNIISQKLKGIPESLL